MTHLLRLLGVPQLYQDDLAIPIPRQKAVGLLAYLALTQRAQARTVLAGLFWGDMPESRANSNLRKILSLLRPVMGESLKTNRQTVELVVNESFQVDALLFKAALHAPFNLEGLSRAIAWHEGEFLEGLHMPDAPEFEIWALHERGILQDELVQGLRKLIAHYAASGDPESGIAAAQRLLQVEPWDEEAHRTLMTFYVHLGQTAAALQQYEHCRQSLNDELGMEPDDHTIALYERIKARQVAPPSPSSLEPVAQPQDRTSLPDFLSSDAPRAIEPMPFVARERELAWLDEGLQAMQHGQGSIRFVSGSAGCGKTTLMRAFMERAQAQYPNLLVVMGHCNPSGLLGEPYLPFRQALNMLAGDLEATWQAGTVSTEQVRRLWQALPQTLQILVDHGAELIDHIIPSKSLYNRLQYLATHGDPKLLELAERIADLPSIGPEQTRVISLCQATLQALARDYPLLIILEDLHWADPSSCALISHLGQAVQTGRLLLLGTYRDDEVATQPTDAPYTLPMILRELQRHYGNIRIDLERREESEGRTFVDAYLDLWPNRFDNAFRDALYTQTQGHALFTVESFNDLRERDEVYRDGAGIWRARLPIEWRQLPSKVDGVIDLRLSRLSTDLQNILEVASIQGGTFAAEVVAQVLKIDARQAVRLLSSDLERTWRLVQSEGVTRIGEQRLSAFRFQHNLIRDYLYQRLSDAEREVLHEEVADVLKTIYREDTQPIASQLAWHYEAAGRPQPAMAYYQQAGMQAFRFSANQEASEHFKRGIALSESISQTPATIPLELSLWAGYAGALLGMRGFFDYGVEQAIDRARALAETVGARPETLPIYLSLVAFYFNTNRHQQSHEYACDLLRAASLTEDSHHIATAQCAVGLTTLNINRLDDALPHLQNAVDRYRPEMHPLLSRMYPLDFASAASPFLSLAYLLQGDLEASDQALPSQPFLDALSQPGTLANVYNIIGQVHALRERPQAAQAAAEKALDIAQAHGLFFFIAFAQFVRGWALARQDQVEEGVAAIETARQIVTMGGGTLLRNMTDVMTAEVYDRAGSVEGALAVLVDRPQTEPYDVLLPYYFLVRGRLLSRVGAPLVEIETMFKRSIDCAHPYNSHWFALQSSVELVSLLHHHNRAEEANQIKCQMMARASSLTALQRTDLYQRLAGL